MSLKEKLVNDIQELNGKVGTLRRELTNSEELQKDLIALSKSLQVNLETLRQAETEVRYNEWKHFPSKQCNHDCLFNYCRWQYADDVSQCNTCKKTFPDSKEKVMNFASVLVGYFNSVVIISCVPKRLINFL